MRLPSVTAIIPVFNQANHIVNAIQSVLNQTLKISELIIVNDGSTDNLEEKLQAIQFPITYIKQDNKGPASARNRGILAASGSHLAFLDADDLWPNNRTEILINSFFNTHYHIVAGKSLEPNGTTVTLPSFGAALFNRSVFDSIGLIDEALCYSEDQDFFLKAKEQELPIKIIPDVTLIRHVHNKSLTYNKMWCELDIHKILKMSLDRRREKNSLPKQLKTLSSYGVQ